MKSELPLVLVCFLILSCQPPKKEKEVIKKSNFENLLDAHGSLDLWNSFGTLEFDRYSDKDTVHHIINLKTREEFVEKAGSYQVGYGLEGFWIGPDSSAFSASDPKFYRNLWFYFFSLPFVTADPGANQNDIAQVKMNNQVYDGIQITFGENVGDSPEDIYRLWMDPKTKQLEWINYSVTYWDKRNAEKFNAIVFNEWQEINGLMVPKEMSGHKFQGDTIGERRYHFIFDNVKFNASAPDPALFETPEAAYFEVY